MRGRAVRGDADDVVCDVVQRALSPAPCPSPTAAAAAAAVEAPGVSLPRTRRRPWPQRIRFSVILKVPADVGPSGAITRTPCERGSDSRGGGLLRLGSSGFGSRGDGKKSTFLSCPPPLALLPVLPPRGRLCLLLLLLTAARSARGGRRVGAQGLPEGLVEGVVEPRDLGGPEAGAGRELLHRGAREGRKGAKAAPEGRDVGAVDALDGREGGREPREVVGVHALLDGVRGLALVGLEGLQPPRCLLGAPGHQDREAVAERGLRDRLEGPHAVVGVCVAEEHAELVGGGSEAPDARVDVLGVEEVVAEAQEQRRGGLAQEVVGPRGRRGPGAHHRPPDVADVAQERVALLPRSHQDRVWGRSRARDLRRWAFGRAGGLLGSPLAPGRAPCPLLMLLLLLRAMLLLLLRLRLEGAASCRNPGASAAVRGNYSRMIRGELGSVLP